METKVLFTWWVFPVPDTDWLMGVWAPHGDQPLVIACELDTLHPMGPVRVGHPEHRPLGDHWPHQGRVLVRPNVPGGQVWPRVAPSEATDVVTMTLENLQWKYNQITRWREQIYYTCCSFFLISMMTTWTDPANAINWSFRVNKLWTGSLQTTLL